MCSCNPLVSEHIKILESLQRPTIRDLFMNENEVVNLSLQSKTKSVRAVVFVKNARIAFRSENVSVSQHLVLKDRLTAIRVMVLHESHRLQRIAPRNSDVIQARHVERAVVAHTRQAEARAKPEHRRPPAHTVKNPILNFGNIPVEAFGYVELASHGLAVQKTDQEITS